MYHRMMTGAFLRHGNKILLIHRGMHKKIAPGMWSCVGGHIEESEMNDPLEACFREIGEEAGIGRDIIENISLRYITVRHTGEEIRTGYYFTGSLNRECELPYCDEGSLHWVDVSDVAGLPMTFTIKKISAHWLENMDSEGIFLCGTNRDNNEMTMTSIYSK